MQFKRSSNKIVVYLLYRPAGHLTNELFVDFEKLLIESQMCSGKKTLFERFQCLDGSTK